MVVYVEYVILNNLIANWVVLRITNSLSVKSKKSRLWLSVAISVVFGTLSPLIPLSGVLVGVIKIAISVVIVAVLTGRIGFKLYIITFLIFYGVSFGLGGAVTALTNLLSFTGVVEEGLTLIILIASVVFFYISSQAVSYIRVKAIRRDGIILLKGKFGYVKASCFVDSGNSVYYKGRGVAFVDKRLRERLFVKGTNDYVSVDSVGGKRIFEVHIAERFTKTKSTEEFPIVFWEGGDYDVILCGGDGYETIENHQKDTLKTKH